MRGSNGLAVSNRCVQEGRDDVDACETSPAWLDSSCTNGWVVPWSTVAVARTQILNFMLIDKNGPNIQSAVHGQYLTLSVVL